MSTENILKKIKNIIIGGSRSVKDPGIYHKLSLTAFLAWVGLGADGLSSTSYGPEEAFLALGSHYYLGIFIAIATGITVLVISISYMQIIDLFPSGGGGYLVASKLLSPKVGMVSGCALLIDYVLTIALSISSGTDALFSFLPYEMHSYKIYFAAAGLLILTLLNLRGVKESVVPLVPVFITFIALHVFVILYSVITHLFGFGEIATKTVNEINISQNELGIWGMLFLIIKAYTMGAGTYTGIEAVSNGIPMLKDPKVKTARHTMELMAVSLAFMVIGIIISYLLYEVKHVPGKTLNAVLFESVTADWPSSISYIFVIITLVSSAIILYVAAQTGFLDGPRVLANMAIDRWFPTKFSILSDRLVTQNGLVLMGVSALLILLVSRGSVKFLIVLYSINVFVTFFLSQLGMVRHWWISRKTEKKWLGKLTLNGLGLFLTSIILTFVVILKFNDGGWITIIITGSLISLALLIKRHYNSTHKLIQELDNQILPALTSSLYHLSNGETPKNLNLTYDKEGKTAVILVNGFNGLGVHTLLSVVKTFSGSFKNFVFAQVGVIDAANFKGSAEVNSLEENLKIETGRYVDFINHNGYYAEAFYEIDTEVLEGLDTLSNKIFDKFPNSVFFGGQIVFPQETIFTKMLHNQIVFSVQRKLYHQGIPFVILPIRINNI